MAKTKTILVTGANGKTGRRLIPLLQARGFGVRAASRAPGAGQIPFDWHEPRTHASALAGADAIYLIPPDLVENAVPVVAPFLQLAAQSGVRHVVLLSSMGAGFPGEPAHSGRRELEAVVRDSGIDWTVLRPSGFMQNFSEGFLFPAVRQGAVPDASAGGKVALVDAGDIARVAAAVFADPAAHAAQTHDVTGPSLLTMEEAIAMVAHAAERPVRRAVFTPEQFLSMLEGAGVPSDYATMLLRDQKAIAGDHAALLTDVVARIGGRSPVGFADYAAAAAPAWRA